MADGRTQGSRKRGSSRAVEAARAGARVPSPPARADVPGDYGSTLAEIKQRVLDGRLRVVATANAAMVELYWDIGRTILDRQRNAGWGAHRALFEQRRRLCDLDYANSREARRP